MSAREFAKWRALFVTRPFDDEGAFHLPVAILTSMTANINRGKNATPFRTSQFLPFYEEPEMDVEDELLRGNW